MRGRASPGERDIDGALRAREQGIPTAPRVRLLLALVVTFSAGIHTGLVPEHLAEMPRLGDAFIVAAVVGSAIAIALIWRPDDRWIPVLAGLFCLGQIAVWGLFVSVRVPLFPGTPEPVEKIALVAKAIETLGVALALWLVASGRLRSVAAQRQAYPRYLSALPQDAQGQ
jgi:hypothetical protein